MIQAVTQQTATSLECRVKTQTSRGHSGHTRSNPEELLDMLSHLGLESTSRSGESGTRVSKHIGGVNGDLAFSSSTEAKSKVDMHDAQAAAGCASTTSKSPAASVDANDTSSVQRKSTSLHRRGRTVR